MSNHSKDHFGRGVIGLVWSVWRVIFPLNRSFDFTKLASTLNQKGGTPTPNWLDIKLVRFYWFSVASNFLEPNRLEKKKKKRKKKERKEKKKSLFLFTFPHFLSTQKPSKKKKLKIMYLIKKHTKIRIYIYIYIYFLCFPMFSHHPNTKHQAPSK